MFFLNIGSVGLNWSMDLGYLIVRWSLSGALSLRSNQFADFVSTAVTFVFCIKEIRSFAKYIIFSTDDRFLSIKSSTKARRRRGLVALVVSIVALVAGGTDRIGS